ncbi:MAG: hypothetical protein CMP23_00305 [Rickettsiales bacterium]|nr:hypothetical protein [Rickettsiales bacterium]
MDPWPALAQELADRAVVTHRLQQLNAALTHRKHGDLGACTGHLFPPFFEQSKAGRSPGLGSFVEAGDRDANMVQSLEHGVPFSLLEFCPGRVRLGLRSGTLPRSCSLRGLGSGRSVIGSLFFPDVAAQGQPGLLSVVLVHHYGADDLFRCVRALQEQEFRSLEIILVDNASSDGAIALLEQERRRCAWTLPIKLVSRSLNDGFAAGVNAGLALCRGEFILLLNPDTEVQTTALSALVGELSRGADIVAPRLVLRDRPERLDNCGHRLFPDGLNWCRGRGERAAGRYLEAEDVLLFSGAAVMFRRSALARIGALDDGFFAYGEDADLSLRAARLGLRCRYLPEAVIAHRVGGSFGAFTLRKVFLVERNRVRVAITHLPRRWLLSAPLWTVARFGVLALQGSRGQGLVGSFSLWQQALLPVTLLAASGASLLAVPGSLARRRGMARMVRAAGGLDDGRWAALLRSHRVSLSELARRPSGT